MIGVLSLDHVSIRAAAKTLEAQGFRVTPTPGSDGDHARIMLDCVYLELRHPAGEVGVRGAGWFARSDDQVAAGRRLEEAGIFVSDPTYEGIDGAWLDLALAGPSRVTPTLTRRVDIPDWPPPLIEPHPNGVVSIAELRIGAREPEQLIDLVTVAGAEPGGEGRLGLGDAELAVEHSADDALLAIVFRCHDGGVLALELDDDAQ
jgi:Glyoxalase-like domain